MALTQEQIDQLDFQKAQSSISNRTEAIRIARDILMENDRNKPVDQRGVTSQDLTNFAKAIETYITQ